MVHAMIDESYAGRLPSTSTSTKHLPFPFPSRICPKLSTLSLLPSCSCHRLVVKEKRNPSPLFIYLEERKKKWLVRSHNNTDILLYSFVNYTSPAHTSMPRSCMLPVGSKLYSKTASLSFGKNGGVQSPDD